MSKKKQKESDTAVGNRCLLLMILYLNLYSIFCYFLKDQRYSEVDIKTLSSQRDMLLDKLEEFELANKNLRRLLRETQKKRVGVKFAYKRFRQTMENLEEKSEKSTSFTFENKSSL